MVKHVGKAEPKYTEQTHKLPGMKVNQTAHCGLSLTGETTIAWLFG